jgi:FixJ family two-component response regulator
VGVLVVLPMRFDLHQAPSGVTKNSNSGSCVFVIDNDASLRATLKELFESVGLHVELFASGGSFLENRNPNTTSSCLVLDVRLPGMSGLKVQEELAKAKISTPIIFLTGHGDIPIAVRAMKAGAVEFLTKPFRNQDLLDAVSTALEQDRARRAKEQSNSTLRESFKSLSARERDVVARVAAGGLNKQIAADLGVSEVTVKVHRAKAMRKLRAKSVAELVRMTDLLGVTPSGHVLERRPPHDLVRR